MLLKEIPNAELAQTFASYPPPLRCKLLALRALILDTAAVTPGVDAIGETLQWGEPAYLTSASKSGRAIRLGPVKSSPSHYALHFNCNTTLMDTFRTLFPQSLRYNGNRAIVLDSADALVFASRRRRPTTAESRAPGPRSQVWQAPRSCT
ncbi:MAG: DUF1801 domain-containing protein [Polaromonas sp.]|nr:DUF1801 domain-containing protein [Polaromonas sp.]